MTAVLVQSVAGSANAATGVTLTISSTGAGNLLVFGVVMTNNTQTLTPTYTGTSQTHVSIQSTNNTNNKTQMWYVDPSTCASGTTAVIISRGTGTGEFSAWVEEWSGITNAPLDQKNTHGSQSGSPDTGTTPATAQADELLVAHFASTSAAGAAPTFSALSSGWTADKTSGSSQTANTAIYSAYQIVSATGTYSGSLTITGGDASMSTGQIATFKITVAGGASSTPQRGLTGVGR